jgi:hypothetical protein
VDPPVIRNGPGYQKSTTFYDSKRSERQISPGQRKLSKNELKEMASNLEKVNNMIDMKYDKARKSIETSSSSIEAINNATNLKPV